MAKFKIDNDYFDSYYGNDLTLKVRVSECFKMCNNDSDCIVYKGQEFYNEDDLLVYLKADL